MLKINNKGQSLVMFVLIIPIFLLILTLVYDVGNAIYEKDRLSNTNYLTIEYGLNNIDTVTENDLKNLELNSQEKANLIVSHINSQSKEHLKGKSPLEVMEFMNPALYQKFKDFGIERINKDNIVLKPYLLKD